jgi:hypothetical protein
MRPSCRKSLGGDKEIFGEAVNKRVGDLLQVDNQFSQKPQCNRGISENTSMKPGSEA